MTRRRHVQILVHIAKKLEALHAAGWVHRDLKPGNTIWLPSQNKWSLIDFGIACKVGMPAPLCFSLTYAPPEVVTAYKGGESSIIAAAAADVWALGVCSSALSVPCVFGVMESPQSASGASVRETKCLPCALTPRLGGSDCVPV